MIELYSLGVDLLFLSKGRQALKKQVEEKKTYAPPATIVLFWSRITGHIEAFDYRGKTDQLGESGCEKCIF